MLLGVMGDAARFDAATGQKTRVGHVIMGFGQARGPRLDRLLAGMGEIPMLGFSTRSGGGFLTVGAIARGAGDDFLVDLNRAVAAWPGRIHVRPWGEMNGHWNHYSAFDQNGSSRGPSRSTAASRKPSPAPT